MDTQLRERLDRLEKLVRSQHDRPLTLKEAADYLDVSASYLYQLTSRQAIPHYKPRGKRIYFLESDLKAYLLRNRVPPPSERA